MNEFCLIRVIVPAWSSRPETGHTLVADKTIFESVHFSAAMGIPIWNDLEQFLKKYNIEARVVCRSIFDTSEAPDNYLARYILQIEDDGEAMFFKLHWSHALVTALETH